MSWFPFAVRSAIAGAVTAILAKLGVEGVPSTLAMAIRTIVVMVLAWFLVISGGELRGFSALSQRTWTYLVASCWRPRAWLAYFPRAEARSVARS